MFKFDADKRVLEVSKIPIAPPPIGYAASDNYESYNKYASKGLLIDIRDYLVPELSKILGEVDPSLSKVWFCGGRVVRDRTSTYKHYEYNTAMVSLGNPLYPDGGKEFCVFKLPIMDKFGVLSREGNQYALISELVQDDDITFSMKQDGKNPELKIVAEKASISLLQKAKNMHVTFRDTKVWAPDLLIAMAVKEGVDAKTLYRKFKGFDIVNYYQTEYALNSAIQYSIDSQTELGIIEAYASDSYNISKVRDKMNKVLSIDRAVGKVLSQDVTLSDGQTIFSETMITPAILKKLKYSKVNEVYVVDVPNMAGWYLADNVYVPYLRKGTEVLPEISSVVGDYKGMYLDRNIDLTGGNSIVIPKGTMVSWNLFNMLAFNKHEGVLIREKESGKCAEKLVNFETEIIGNRHFRECDIGLSTSTDYVYINEDGKAEPAKTHLCAYDFAAMMSLFSRLRIGQDVDFVTDRDLGLRKRVNQANELFHNAFMNVYKDFLMRVKRKLVSAYENMEVFNIPDEMENMFYLLTELWWKNLYGEMRVIQTLEKVNPVAFNSTLNRIATIVKDSKAVASGMHHLSMGHYGRLCPYETPQSRKLGLTNTKALGCKIVDGLMLTSYYRIKHLGKRAFLTDEIVWMTVAEEEKFRIADITSLQINPESKEILNESRVLARIPDAGRIEKVSVAYVDIAHLDLVNTDPNQHLSVTASTIPFEGADDSVRVSFGLNMCRQAKGLLSPDVPLIMTSAHRDVMRQNTFYQINAEADGEVLDTQNDFITVLYYNKKEPVTYDYQATEYATDAVIIRSLQVKTGDVFKQGDVLMKSNFSNDGFLAMGINALIAYLPVGFNYEDGVFASMRLRSRLTSYGSSSEEIPISQSVRSTNIQPYDKFRYIKPNTTAYQIKQFNRKGAMVSRSITSTKAKGFIVDIVKSTDSFSKEDTGIEVTTVSFDPAGRGDKVANRHGNKGVIPKLEQNINMPILYNGEFVDVVYNPMGVVSRMNIGQVLEAHAGLAAYVLDIRIMSDPFNGASINDVRLLLSMAYDLANSSDFEYALKEYKGRFPASLITHCRERKDWIQSWKNVFDREGNAYLINPKTGKPYEQPVLLGVNYIYRLIHMSDKKIHARGGLLTEPYIEKLDAPTKGAANKGGQRSGTMEFDAYAAYGASAFIQDAMGARGDNPVLRNNATVKAAHKGDNYMIDESLAIRRSTEAFVNIMAGLGSTIEFQDCGIPNDTNEETERRYTYRVKALTTAKDVGGRKSEKKDLSGDFSTLLGGDF